MRKHNRYALPVSAGVDPAGWTAGLRQFVDDRYRLVSSRTFDDALRSAVTNMRKTNLPVAITVSHGGHGWILTGFGATADPATTASFKVTSVRVVGPLYGLQSKNGYDMPPNTKLTPTQLRRYFTPWKYDPKPMIWDGRYVSIQPIPKAAATAAAPTARPAAATPAATAIADREPDAGRVGNADIAGGGRRHRQRHASLDGDGGRRVDAADARRRHRCGGRIQRGRRRGRHRPSPAWPCSPSLGALTVRRRVR